MVRLGGVFSYDVLPSSSGGPSRGLAIAFYRFVGFCDTLDQELGGRFSASGTRIFIWQPIASGRNITFAYDN